VKRLAIIAHHEAGHAVVARRLGIALHSVNVLDGGAGAVTESATYAARDAGRAGYLAAIEKDMIVSLAGAHAQHRHRPRRTRHRQLAEWDDDRETATALAYRAALIASGIERDQIDAGFPDLSPDLDTYATDLFRQCDGRSRDLVAEHWPMIVKVAKALLVRPILNAADLDQLIGQHVVATFSVELLDDGARSTARVK
jgi:hypothetical protein